METLIKGDNFSQKQTRIYIRVSRVNKRDLGEELNAEIEEFVNLLAVKKQDIYKQIDTSAKNGVIRYNINDKIFNLDFE